MGSDHYIEVPDPQPKPIAELLADIMERNKKVRFSCRWPASAVRILDYDVPRMVAALEYVYSFVRMSPERWGELVRILAGQEDTDA